MHFYDNIFAMKIYMIRFLEMTLKNEDVLNALIVIMFMSA